MPRRFYPVLWLVVYTVFVVTLNLYAQEWKVVPSGVTSHLNDIMFVDKKVGWVGGGDSTLLKTIDGGETWFQQHPNIGGDVKALWFVDENNGFIVGGGATKGAGLYRTRDGGTTWEQYPTLGDFRDIQFVSRDTGWAIGYRIRRIWKTTNGGDDWFEQGNELHGVFTSCSFINGMEGWVAGADSYLDNFDEEVIWHTTDGGQTWGFQDNPSRTGPLNKIHVLPNRIGFAVGWGEGIRAINAGEEWALGGPGNQATALYALDESHIYVGRGWADEFHIYCSTDTGKSWRIMDTELENMTNGIYFADSTFGYAVGYGGKIWKYLPNAVGVDPIPPQAESPALSHTYPNPVYRGSTTGLVTVVVHGLWPGEHVSCSLYNAIGQSVSIMPQIERTSQGVRIQFDTNGLAPGVYYYRVAGGAGARVPASGMIHIIQ